MDFILLGACDLLSVADKSVLRRVNRKVKVLLPRGTILVFRKPGIFDEKVHFFQVMEVTAKQYVCRMRKATITTIDEDEACSHWGIECHQLQEGFATTSMTAWPHLHVHKYLWLGRRNKRNDWDKYMQIYRDGTAYETQWVR